MKEPTTIGGNVFFVHEFCRLLNFIVGPAMLLVAVSGIQASNIFHRVQYRLIQRSYGGTNTAVAGDKYI